MLSRKELTRMSASFFGQFQVFDEVFRKIGLGEGFHRFHCIHLVLQTEERDTRHHKIL